MLIGVSFHIHVRFHQCLWNFYGIVNIFTLDIKEFIGPEFQWTHKRYLMPAE